MGDIAERTPIFAPGEYAIFIDINKLPSANTSLLNITATDAASYSITPTNLPADAIDPLVAKYHNRRNKCWPKYHRHPRYRDNQDL